MAAISITAASVLASTGARVERYVAAEAITAGQLVYLTSSGTVGLCDADASGKDIVLGIACDSALVANAWVVICTYDTAFTLGGTIAAGATVWSSATAGGVTSTAADNATTIKTAFVGIGVGSNQILLSPVSGHVAVP